MAEKIVRTLKFPGSNDTYTINAVKLDGHTWNDIDERFNEIESFDALRYMGTITAGNSIPGGLTLAANKGDVYKVILPSNADEKTYDYYVMGVKVEAGDMLICNTDDTDAATSTNYLTIAKNWDIIQTNIDVEAILDHTHTGTVDLTKTAKTLTHSVTPTQSDLTATFSNGTATVTGTHGHTTSGSFDYTPAGSVGSKSITPEGTVALTAPTSAGTGDVTLKPSGTVANSTTEYVTDVTVSEHAPHNHGAEFTGTPVADHTHTVTMDSYTPAGSVASHKHNVSVTPETATHNAVGSVTTEYSGSGDDGVLTIGTTESNVTYVTGIKTVSEESVAPTFTGTAAAPTVKSVSAAGGHTPAGSVAVEYETVEAHTVTAPTSAHSHGFTGNNLYVHAAFSGKAASHTHDFTRTASTNNPVTVTGNNFTGNFTGSASGTVTPSLSKVLTGVTISNHSIDTVDSATVTTGNGTQG